MLAACRVLRLDTARTACRSCAAIVEVEHGLWSWSRAASTSTNPVIATAEAVQQERRTSAGEAAPSRAQPQIYRVEAAYIGNSINIAALRSRPEFQGCFSASHRGALLLGPHQSIDPDTAELEGLSHGPYLVAFPFGSVVMFGKSKMQEKDAWLEACRSVATRLPATPNRPCTEEYTLTVKPDMPTWSLLTPEAIKLQQLDLRNIQVISQVLAQSVALDFYSTLVEEMLDSFTAINQEMKETLHLRRINTQELLRLVAETNEIMTDIITKLGVDDRFDIAWKYVQYGRIWDYLRSELEMDARFKTLDMKLQLVQDNLKYFLEIFQNRKSATLEWIIIVLIALEICLSLTKFGH